MTYDCQTNPCPGCSIRRASPAKRGAPLGRFADLLGFALCLALVAVLAIATGCEEDSHRDSPPQDSAPGVAATASDPLPPGAVRWCYGGFDGSRAAFDARCRISSLRVHNPSGLSLKWLSGVPADWASSGGLVLFALFFQAEDGSWKGGKIDWINTARSTRDLKNPSTGYGGWNWAEYLRAKRHAAVVVSADGRKRSNWIFD